MASKAFRCGRRRGDDEVCAERQVRAAPTHQPWTWQITGLGERQIDMNFGIGPNWAVAIAKSLPGSQRPSVVIPSSQW